MKHFQLPFPSLVVLILGWQLFATEALAQWSHGPNVNNPISTATDHQSFPAIASDGAGGAIIAWGDRRAVYANAIYAQSVNAEGVVRWATDGVPISTEPTSQVPIIVSDGTGGAIIAWVQTPENYDIYAQRVNSVGEVQWTANGIPICLAFNGSQLPAIVSDGAGGAIITWEDIRDGTDYNIYAQRIDSAGVVQWTTNGVPISAARRYQNFPTIASDDAGGAIITWQDLRDTTGITGADIYAQRVNAAGVVQWTADGVPISTATFTQGFPKIASDGVGGALVTWSDYRNGADLDVYAQRVNAAGVVQWTANGVAICKEPNNQFPIIVGDGAGGAIIAWTDYRGSGASPQVYAQRVNDAGVVQWMINGVAISTALNSGSCDMISDGAGGAIIAWQDSRNGGDTLFTDIYSQKVNASGAVQWIANGVSISTALHSQFFPKMVNNSAGGAIITWNDLRNDPNYEDIYAQQIDSSGNLGGPVTEVKNRTVAPIEFALQQNYPNPFNPATTISFNLPSKSFVSLKVFNALGEEVSVLLSEVLPAGTYAPQWNAENLASGVYFYRLQAGNLVETRNLLLLR